MEEAGEETPGTWTCVTCSSFTSLGSIVQCGGLETSHFYRGQMGLGLWREGAIRQVGLRDGDTANFTLPSGLDLAILAPLQKGWVSPEVKPARCLRLSLAGVSCLARPQNPPRAHRPCSTSPPSIWFIWGGGRKSKG